MMISNAIRWLECRATSQRSSKRFNWKIMKLVLRKAVIISFQVRENAKGRCLFSPKVSFRQFCDSAAACVGQLWQRTVSVLWLWCYYIRKVSVFRNTLSHFVLVPDCVLSERSLTCVKCFPKLSELDRSLRF